MKIVLTTHVFFPEHSAGTEVLTLNTARELQSQGHQVEVVTGFNAQQLGIKDTERFDSYVFRGIKVNRFLHNLAPMGSQSNVVEAEYNNHFFAEWFRDYLKSFRPDIVHFFHLGLLSGSAIDVCHELAIPRVMTPTDFWLVCPTYQLRLPDNAACKGPDKDGVNCLRHAVSNTQSVLTAWIFNQLPYWMVMTILWVLKRRLFTSFKIPQMVGALAKRANFLKQRMNMLNKVIVPTRLMEEILIGNGLNPQKVIYSRYGIDFNSSEVFLPIPAKKLRVGFIGGLSEHKGAHLLISAIRSLESLSLDLKVYGDSQVDPKYYKKLLKLAGQDKRIRFMGTFPNETIGSIFAELDVLVVPSIWYENTPLVIYSAQAAGCPVIASNMGGMAEVILHEENGLLFQTGNIKDLANTLKRLVQDRALLKSLAKNAVRPKPIREYVLELQSIYVSLLQGEKEKHEMPGARR